MQTNKTHWPSIVILIVLGISTAFVFLISFGLGVSSIVKLFTNGSDPAGEMISSFAFGFEFIILLLCSWVVLQKSKGHETAERPFKFPFAGWQIPAVIGIVVFFRNTRRNYCFHRDHLAQLDRTAPLNHPCDRTSALDADRHRHTRARAWSALACL